MEVGLIVQAYVVIKIIGKKSLVNIYQSLFDISFKNQ